MQSMRWPRLFWVSACAPLASVIISTLVVFLFKAQNHGISIVRALKTLKIIFHIFFLYLQQGDDLWVTDWAAQVWSEPPLMGQTNI
jgi:hypothetical protein